MIKRALSRNEKRSRTEDRLSPRRTIRHRESTLNDRKISKTIKKSGKPFRKPRKGSESISNSSNQQGNYAQNNPQKLSTTRIRGNSFCSDLKTSIHDRVELSIHALVPDTDLISLKGLLGFYRHGYSLPYIARYKKNDIVDLSESSLRLIDQNYETIVNLESDRAKAINRVQETVEVEMVSSAIVSQLELASTETEIREILNSVVKPDPCSKTSLLNSALADQEAVQVAVSVLGCLSNACNHISRFSPDLRRKVSLIIGSKLFSDTDLVSVIRTITDRNHRSELEKIRSHSWLALRREGRATSSMFIVSNPEMTELLSAIHRAIVPTSCETQNISGKLSLNGNACLKLFVEASQRGLEDHIIPRIKSEWVQFLNRRSEYEAIEFFRKNLRQKLLQPPPSILRSFSVILGIDPGLSSGCKAAFLQNDRVEKYFKFNPFPESRVNVESFRDQLSSVAGRPFLVALGNGTGSFECRRFLAAIVPDVPVAIVDESGASYYSVSELGMSELPELSLEYRGAVSIARRLCDPLSEYVKIDPHRLSVGMYQHDIPEKKLEKFLLDIVCECIADVGVDVNTASESLLRFVPGLNRRTAKAIVEFRESHGIHNRMDLRKVYGIGPITYEQSVGFLQVQNSDWTPLDSTAVHPNDYAIATQVVKNHPELGQYWTGNVEMNDSQRVSVEDENRLLQLLRLSDPRELYEPVEIRTAKEWLGSLEKIEVKEDAVLTGIVKNITAFGAFVQLVGTTVTDDGLLHISNYPVGVTDPHYYNINQAIQVRVLSVQQPVKSSDRGAKVRIALCARV